MARVPRRRLLIGSALALLLIGLAGIARTYTQMDAVVGSSPTTATSANGSGVTRLLPGLIANPARYLGAVNSSGSSSSGDPLTAVAQLSLKQAMDRWEALFGIGLSLLLFVTTSRASTGAPPAAPEAPDAGQSSVGSDAWPFVLLVALLFFPLSFVELP